MPRAQETKNKRDEITTNKRMILLMGKMGLMVKSI
jgi:hypothetical protein